MNNYRILNSLFHRFPLCGMRDALSWNASPFRAPWNSSPKREKWLTMVSLDTRTDSLWDIYSITMLVSFTPSQKITFSPLPSGSCSQILSAISCLFRGDISNGLPFIFGENARKSFEQDFTFGEKEFGWFFH